MCVAAAYVVAFKTINRYMTKVMDTSTHSKHGDATYAGTLARMPVQAWAFAFVPVHARSASRIRSQQRNELHRNIYTYIHTYIYIGCMDYRWAIHSISESQH